MVEEDISVKNKIIYPYKDLYIEKPELYLIHKYEDKLKNAKMLDIGIGFGRTTHYFADLCKEYVGIDYQQEPVDFCKQRFEHLQNANFYVCDARDMHIFEDNYFDIVLFSFNGIDYVPTGDRMSILKEMKRVCAQDGIIYFSTHNLQALEDFVAAKGDFSVEFSLSNPCKFLRFLKKKIFLNRLKRKNPEINNIINNISNLEYAIICDGALNFRLYLYYISPNKQIEQLQKIGLKDIRIISLADGMEVNSDSELTSLKDIYVYYFCRNEIQKGLDSNFLDLINQKSCF